MEAMREAAGQVARAAHWWLHRLCGLLVLLFVLAALAAWRLAAGPIELPFLAGLIEERANEGATEGRVEVGRVEIGWEGWREGNLMPVRLRLGAVRLRGTDGALRAELPDAALTLSLPWLLRGELAPGTLELRRPALRLRRAANGDVSVLVGTQGDSQGAEAGPATGASRLDAMVAEMMGEPTEDTPFGALSRLRITDARIVVEDEALGATWVLDHAMVELRRLSAGGIAGHGAATLLLGEARVPLTITTEARGKPAEVSFHLLIPEVQPALLAAAARPLAPLAHLDAATRIEVAGRLDAQGAIRHIQATLGAGAGRLDLGAGRVLPLAGLDLSLEGSPTALSLPRATLRLAGGPGAPILVAQAEAARSGAGWRGAATLALDQVPVAELPRYWPQGIGVGHERDWILANVTAGTARNGQWRAEVEAPADLSALRVTGLSGTLEVTEATVHWLRPIPPVERVAGTVTFGLDEIALRVAGGRQTGGPAGQAPVTAREGLVRFLFPPGGQDRAEMSFELSGPIPQAVAVIQHPRLKLFDRRPFPVKDPTGAFDGRLTVAFPLLADLPVEALRIGARVRLRDVRIPDVLFSRPLERGQAELTVDTEGLRVAGTATLGGINARIGVEMDFRAGPATQVVMRETVSARTDAATIAGLGLPLDEIANGPVGLEVRTERRRNGQGRATIRGDLREARMEITPLAWTKPSGQIATAEGVLRLNGDNLEAVETFKLEAPALLMRGNAAFARGARLERVTINEAAIEQSRFAGEARPPARDGAPWSLLLRGPVIDLRRTLGDETPAAAPAAPQGPPGTTWAVDARFDRALLGPGRELGAIEARVLVDGLGVVREGRVAGRAGPRGPFEATIAPAGAGRALRVAADDAGALLGSFDVLRHLEGGRLSVNATYANNRPGAPLSGTAEMSDFAVRNAPGFAKLLQALTFYGLVEALSGPGLGFSRMIAPFSLTPEELTLSEARAFSASLGLTAKGTLHRRQQRLAMEGTIVPAYIFNSLLGNIPILGRLFSPETGGGLFAATFRVSGPADDPSVSVNPLAALTPGFLRGLFGIGQATP
jgi:hypothetical protein